MVSAFQLLVLCIALVSGSLWRILVQGPFLPVPCALLGRNCPEPEVVVGTVSPGFEPFRAFMHELIASGQDVASAIVVYRGEELVVNISAGIPAMPPGALTRVFSSGKNAEAIAFAMLVDRGILSYDDPVIKFWPEFGANGKEHLKVSDVFKHQALPIVDIGATEDEAAQSAAIESAVPWPDVRVPRRAYMAISRGQVLNQIMRRVDPAGRSLSEFIAEEVVQPLGVELCWGKGLGCSNGGKDVLHSVEPSQWRSIGAVFVSSILPAILPTAIVNAVYSSPPGVLNLQTFPKAVSSFTGLPVEEFGSLHRSTIDQLDLTSLVARSSAASMARIAQLMANGGTVGSVRLMSEKTVHLANTIDADSKQQCSLLGANLTLTRGGFGTSLWEVPNPDPWEVRAKFGDKFLGWAGLGGSLFAWESERKLAVGFAGRGLINQAYYKHTSAALRLLDDLA